MKKLLLLLSFPFIGNSLFSQTLIGGATGNGDFEAGTASWTIANNPNTNTTDRWAIGTAAGGVLAGTTSAYIINNAGGTYAYTGGNARVQHIYQQVNFPAGQTCINLSFKWKCNGEGSFSDWDNLKVFISSTAPTGGTQHTAADRVGLTWYNLQTTTQTANISLPAALAGTTRYLIFQWKCDGSGAYQGPGAIDDVVLTAAGAGSASYATLPYSQDFESWSSSCGTLTDLPSANWTNSVTTGNTSWRRNDQGASASWTSTTGGYTPTFSTTAYSARFHSYDATSGTQGSLNLYVDCSPAGTKTLYFDYINTSGTDVLTVLQSTDGGGSFPTTLGTYTTAGAWTTQSVTVTGNTATTILRFRATSDFGATDIGIDNVRVVSPCSGTPTAGTGVATPSTLTSCTANTTVLSLTGASIAGGITYQWQSSPDNSVWTNIAGATNATYTATVIANTYYRCVVTCSNSTLSANSTSVLVSVTFTIPSNDDPCSATAITPSATCSYTTYSNQCASATTAGSPPGPGCASYAGSDVWFSTVVPTSGSLIFDSQVGVMLDGGMAIYSGTCGALTLLACDDDSSPNGNMPYISLSGLTPGATLFVRFWEYSNDNNGTFGLCIQDPCPTQPSNDNCSGATPLTINAYGSCAVTSPGNVTCATASSTAMGSCTGTPDDDIWYSFVATATAHPITLNTTVAFDAYMQLYSGTCAALTPLQCSDPNTFTASGLTIGQTYYLRVSSVAAGAPTNGNLTVCITSPAACPANLGAGNVAIASLPYNATGLTTCGAGNEITAANVSSCGSTSYFGEEDKVFTFTPASSGSITVTINSAQSFTGATLYDNCPFSGNCVGYVQNSSSGSKNFCTSVVAGVTYYLVIDRFAASCITTFSLDITAPSAGVTNDAPCSATAVTLGTALTGTNVCTSGGGEPAVPSCWTSGSTNTVWYSFVAPASGNAFVQTTLGTITATQIALYSGTCGPALTLISCNQAPPVGCSGTTPNTSLINATGLTPGATYYVCLDGRNDYMGTFTILIDNGSSTSTSPVPGQDCSIPLVVCNSTMIIGNPGYANTGNVCDFNGAYDCTSGELNSVWYQISIAGTGNFNFTLMPNDGSNTSCGLETDYDFLLWRVSGTGTTTNCSGITANSGNALLACNFDGYGVTGIATGGNAPAPINNCFNYAFEPTVAVTAGDVLYLCIQNYSGSTQGFTIDMSSSGAGVVNYTAPSTVYWTGGSNTVWNNTTNWGSCSTYPVCGINAVVTAASATQPNITGTEYVKDLTINPGSTLTLGAGAVLHICGNFTNNGTFTASPTSTVIFENGATAAQSISGSFTGTNKFGNLTITKTSGAVTLNNDIDIAGNFTTSNSTSVFNSNNFYVKVAGNFANATGNTTYTTTGTIGVLEFNGTGAQTYNQGSSTLDLNGVVMNNSSTGLTLQTNMNIKATTGTLTLTAGKIATTASYMVIVNNSTTTSVSAGNTNSYVNGFLRRYINNSTGSFDFPVGTATAYQRANVNFTTAPTITYLTADFLTYGSLPAALGTSECSATYDMSALDNGMWHIDANTANNNTGVYNMTLYNTAYTNAASGWTIMARHNGSGTWATTNGDGSAGTCVSSPVTAVVRNNMVGFSLFGNAQSSSPLPVELISFTGKNEGTKNKLEWSTASELNNDYFTLEHSSDGITFETFLTKDGAGNSSALINYDAYDHSPYAGKTYYRLKQTDYNGQFSYSSIITIENKLDQIEVSNVHPNPTTYDLNFDFYTPVKGTMHIQVLDYTGRAVRDIIQNTDEGKTSVNTEISELAKGIYSLKIEFSEGNFKSVTKVVKY